MIRFYYLFYTLDIIDRIENNQIWLDFLETKAIWHWYICFSLILDFVGDLSFQA